MVLAALWRTAFFYLVILLVLRLAGKREIGRLSPIDLIVTIMIADLAVIPIENPQAPILVGVVPIVALLVMETALAWFCTRHRRARDILCGRPSIVIQDGRLVEQEMKRLRYSVDDLLEQLRQSNMPNVRDVEVAILEPTGRLSVIPKSQRRPVCPEDLKIDTGYEGLPQTLIVDGRIDYAGLKQSGLDMTWLNAQLQERGVRDPKDVFYAALDTQGQLFIQEKAPPSGPLAPA
ncbi:MAG TPA: DUF421 domain-containing protein [Limnochordia bacterium]